MVTEDLIQTRLTVNGKRSLHYSDEFWTTPPLAPTGTLDAGDFPVEQKARRSPTREKQSFQPLQDNDFLDAQTSFGSHRTSFGSHRTRIAGIAIVAVVGITTLAYFSVSAGQNKATQPAKPAPAMQSSLDAPAQTSSEMPESTPEPSAGAALPDPSASTTTEISPDIAPAARTDNTSQHQTATESQNQEIVFLQSAGVNIRSQPSTKGRVLGTAPKGTRLKVTTREGVWMQVESGRLKGWINSQFLAPNESR